jgi:2-polyprenyl-3-methyl-5-hydroxy-6-metoxy-1,4-benzoquinol methylase
MEESGVKEYYDSFSKAKNRLGINIRHISIVNMMIEHGLRKNSTVLEVGCGIGTISFLLSNFLSQGRISSFDISPEGVELSKQRLQGRKNINFQVSDTLSYTDNNKYDFILMADVMEHIPTSDLKNSISNLLQCAHSDTKFVINVPDPRKTRWDEEHNSSILQIIDNAIYVENVVQSFEGTGFRIEYFKRYSLHHNEMDYNYFVLSKSERYSQTKPLSGMKISLKKQFQRLVLLANNILK